jgi:hypothetical protein
MQSEADLTCLTINLASPCTVKPEDLPPAAHSRSWRIGNDKEGTRMLKIRTLMMFSLALGALFFALTPVSADTPGRHPHYVHARSDLRRAQWLLRVQDEPNVMRHVHDADDSIERAIHEIDQAAVIDRKFIEDHPPVDTRLDRPGRFRRSLELLKAARADIGREEDNPGAIGWRDAAYRHIDHALDQIRKAARDLRIDHLEGY